MANGLILKMCEPVISSGRGPTSMIFLTAVHLKKCLARAHLYLVYHLTYVPCIFEYYAMFYVYYNFNKKDILN